MPHEWYPEARKMKRKIIFHHGPTNSGKTFSALNDLENSKSGIYCSPLRLLAWEVGVYYEKSLMLRFKEDLRTSKFHAV